MTNREMLELAAKAAGLTICLERQAERDEEGYGNSGLWIVNGSTCWNPLIDDGDALRLAVRLGMQLDVRDPATRVFGAPTGAVDEHHRADPYAATRRAITRAAAEIGKSMEGKNA